MHVLHEWSVDAKHCCHLHFCVIQERVNEFLDNVDGELPAWYSPGSTGSSHPSSHSNYRMSMSEESSRVSMDVSSTSKASTVGTEDKSKPRALHWDLEAKTKQYEPYDRKKRPRPDDPNDDKQR